MIKLAGKVLRTLSRLSKVLKKLPFPKEFEKSCPGCLPLEKENERIRGVLTKTNFAYDDFLFVFQREFLRYQFCFLFPARKMVAEHSYTHTEMQNVVVDVVTSFY